MKSFRWSAHALGNLTAREIPRDHAERALLEPERVETVGPSRAIYMCRYPDARLGQEMLVRAVVEEHSDEFVVITVYITSKIGKYLMGAGP